MTGAVLGGTVLAVGWLFGGTVGVGTAAHAFGIGPLVQVFVRITPGRIVAVSGWASVAQGGRRRNRAHVILNRAGATASDPTAH